MRTQQTASPSSGQGRGRSVRSTGLALLTLAALAAIAGCGSQQPRRSGTTGQASNTESPAAVAPGGSTDLSSCPSRKPALRVAGVLNNEAFSSHPMENRFTSTFFSRLHQLPLFGADPQETKVDPAYGAAASWEFLSGAKSLKLTLHQGLTFNDGSPVTAEDVKFSIDLAESQFADPQLSGGLKAFGAQAQVLDEQHVQIDFRQGSPTFATEFSPLVYPLYVVSKKYHSNGAITQVAFDQYREHPLAAGPYEVVQREAQKFMILKAARKDPLLGCPLYDRIEIRNIPETGTRMAQLQTGQLDIAEGDRDLIDQAKGFGAQVASKPAANMIGLYFFQTYLQDSVFHNVKVRQAATYAIDSNTIAKSIWKGVGVTPWGCTWPPPTEIASQDPAYGQACGTPYPYDPAKAKELLAQAGYGPGNKPKIKLVFWDNYPEEADLAQAMQPMLNAVGFDSTIDRIDNAENIRRRNNNGFGNSILFFGPGGRATSLSGSYSVYGPDQGEGPKDDPDVMAALAQAAGATSEQEYIKATVQIGKLVHDRAYGPGFFSAGSIWFLSKQAPDWGLEQDKGRAALNLAALVTKR